jgi:uncharacterized membrane protein
MPNGPVECVVIGFEGTRFTGEIVAELRDAVDRGIIRVIDIVFARRDASGTLEVVELEDLEEESKQIFNPVVSDVTGLLSEDDIQELTELMAPDSAAAMMLFEHVWAEKLRDAIGRANGRLLAGAMIPREAIEAAVESRVAA